MMKSFALALAVVLAPLTVLAEEPASPAEREVVPASENAALIYWMSWYQLAEYLPVVEYATYTEDGLAVPDDRTEEEIEAALQNAQAGIDAMIHASKMERCDFGSNPAENADATSGYRDFHMRVSRRAARLVAVDAGHHLERNWTEDGTERLATLFRMAEHLGRDEALTPALVGIAIFELGAKYTELFQDRFSEEDRRVLATALDRFAEADPFRVMASVRSDADVSARTLAEQIRSGQVEGAPSSLEFELGAAMGNTRAARVARARLVRDAMQVATVGEKFAEVWGDPVAIDAFRDELYSGEYGVFAGSMAGIYGKLSQVDTDARAKLDALRAWANGETETLELPERNRR